MDLKGVKIQLLNTAKKVNSFGLNHGASGNLSVRTNEGMIITPSSVPFEELAIDQLVSVVFNDEIALKQKALEEGVTKRPSSEWRLHKAVLLTRPEIKVILHCHSTYATALACHRKDIPSFHYMVAVAGGTNIRCSKYATFGTSLLSDHATDALNGRLACLLANHGQIALGKSFDEAFNIALQVELLAKMFIAANQLGEPYLLSDEQMNEVHDSFRALNYGSK